MIIETKKVTGIVDTGSTSNYIRDELVNELKLKSEEMKEEMNTKIANGSVKKIKNKCELNFCFKNVDKSYKAIFYI